MKNVTSSGSGPDSHPSEKEPVSERMNHFLSSCIYELGNAHYEIRALGALVKNPSDFYLEADDLTGLGMLLTNLSKKIWKISRELEQAQMGRIPERSESAD